MEELLIEIESLSPFVQSLLAAVVFGFSSLVIQWASHKAKSKGSWLLREYSRIDVGRHILHRDFVNSSEIVKSSYGATVATLFALRWILIGFLTAIFFVGVHSIVNSNWLFLAASWFCFNSFLEAYNWAKDSSGEKYIKHVPEELLTEVSDSLYRRRKESSDEPSK